MNGLLNIFPTVDALALGAAGTIATTLNEAVHSRARAMIALSGGTTPRQVYGLLASDGLRPSVPWESVHVFWGDERCVPPEHPDSNFRMASEALLRYVGIPGAHIHRIRGELNPDQAALTYEEDLRREFRTGPGEAPRFDLVLLGLGDDGHTASLFPGTTALTEQQKLVTAVHIDKWGTYRVTMTF